MGKNSPPLHPEVRIGHVHLKVADLDRALVFYRDVLGFEVTQRMGQQAAFLSAGGYHHHIGLNTWESQGGSPPHRGATGLYHVAILYPTRADLADALRKLQKAGIHLDGAADHGVSEALYLRDPDGNGVELYWDRPKAQWPRIPDGELAMVGVILGMAWSKITWRRYWSWDAKETGGLCVIVWLVFYLLAHRFFKSSARGILTVSMLGNIVVSLAWLGPQMNGLHQYRIFSQSMLLMGVVVNLVFFAIGYCPAGWLRSKQA